MQQKDVIYIDVEDDITSIIGKVKASKEDIVAIVPPKRTGVLQSAVNLRLLARAANNADKKLVLVTGNQALTHLAANAKIHIAKNLQSKPEMVDIKSFDNVDDEEDVIDGEKLPVGDHAKLPANDEAEEIIIPPSSVDGIDIDEKPKPARKKSKSGIKVPDFGTFRRKAAFGAVGGILLIVFLWWAIAIAPHATIVISAKTSPVAIKNQVTIGDTLQNDPTKMTLTSATQTDKVTSTNDITPTGTKDVGTKATGSVVFTNCMDSGALTVNSGTYISNGANNYVVQSTVVVPGGHLNSHGCVSGGVSAPVNVIATDIGNAYNTSSGASFTVAGFTSDMSASSSNGLAGGDKHTAKIVSADDVQGALDQLKQQSTDTEKKKLQGKFGSGYKIIDDSYLATPGTPTATPAIGQEVTTDKAKLSLDITYTLVAIPTAGLDDYLKTSIGKQVSTNSQRIYDSGVSSANLSGYQAAADKTPASIQLVASGQVGPKIDDNQIKDQEKGKRSGEVIGDLKAIDGVSGVDVQLSPFWVAGVPGDTSKITVTFKLLTNG
ncbi:MAG: hypothetical protein JWO07_573 [Candidatus Saccharibacteria bacterium]|nr:hypothetical protein [Candidatus Saccharibacteria bacterium]